jgi:hypothetical protein
MSKAEIELADVLADPNPHNRPCGLAMLCRRGELKLADIEVDPETFAYTARSFRTIRRHQTSTICSRMRLAKNTSGSLKKAIH